MSTHYCFLEQTRKRAEKHSLVVNESRYAMPPNAPLDDPGLFGESIPGMNDANVMIGKAGAPLRNYIFRHVTRYTVCGADFTDRNRSSRAARVNATRVA
jgi:hypothetical protein